MTASKMQPDSDPTTDPTDLEQADPQTPQAQAGVPEPRVQMSQPGASAKPTTPGRAPLFRR